MRATTKSARRVLVWLLVAIVAVYTLPVFSPWRVLVRSEISSSVADYDLMLPVAVAREMGLRGPVRRERVCLYWGGGNQLSPRFMKVTDRCPLFDARSEFGWAVLDIIAYVGVS